MRVRVLYIGSKDSFEQRRPLFFGNQNLQSEDGSMTAEAFQAFILDKIRLCDEFAEMSEKHMKKHPNSEFHLPKTFFSSPEEFRTALYGRYGIQPYDTDPTEVLRTVIDSYFDRAEMQFSLENDVK